MKTAGYHVEGYGPGRTCHLVGEPDTHGAEGFVFIRRSRGRYVIAKQANRGSVPDVLLGQEVPCRVILGEKPAQ